MVRGWVPGCCHPCSCSRVQRPFFPSVHHLGWTWPRVERRSTTCDFQMHAESSLHQTLSRQGHLGPLTHPSLPFFTPRCCISCAALTIPLPIVHSLISSHQVQPLTSGKEKLRSSPSHLALHNASPPNLFACLQKYIELLIDQLLAPYHFEDLGTEWDLRASSSEVQPDVRQMYAQCNAMRCTALSMKRGWKPTL